jgi:hypothetical protein
MLYYFDTCQICFKYLSSFAVSYQFQSIFPEPYPQWHESASWQLAEASRRSPSNAPCCHNRYLPLAVFHGWHMMSFMFAWMAVFGAAPYA